MVPYMSSNLFIISDTGACAPRYQTGSGAALCKDHTIPSLNVTSVWLCITFFTSKANCSNETSPFWVESPPNVLSFSILLTNWEITLGQEIVHCGSDICLGDCMSVPSTNTISSLPTPQNQSPIDTCSGVATLHPIVTLWPNHISMDNNVLHASGCFSFFLISSGWWNSHCRVGDW